MPEQQHAWVGIWKPILSFFVGVVVASFTVGSARQKVRDIVIWKDQISPKIERMDSVGSLSFDHFKAEYLRTQNRQEQQLKDLDHRVRELERDGQH